jgi:hypothetical protein
MEKKTEKVSKEKVNNVKKFCLVCGFELENENNDHIPCDTEDVRGCHDNEYLHFEELEDKSLNLSEEMRGN